MSLTSFGLSSNSTRVPQTRFPRRVQSVDPTPMRPLTAPSSRTQQMQEAQPPMVLASRRRPQRALRSSLASFSCELLPAAKMVLAPLQQLRHRPASHPARRRRCVKPSPATLSTATRRKAYRCPRPARTSASSQMRPARRPPNSPPSALAPTLAHHLSRTSPLSSAQSRRSEAHPTLVCIAFPSVLLMTS